MAKITTYSALVAAGVAADDLLWITDISAGAAGTKSITALDLKTYVLNAPAIVGSTSINGRAVVGSTSVPTAAQFHVTGGSTLAGTTQIGADFDVTVTSAATVAGFAQRVQFKTAAASFTVAEGIGVNVLNASKGAASAITSQYGVLIRSQTGGATNNFGLLVEAPSGGATANTAIFATPGDRGVQVGGTATGAATTKYGVLSNATFNSSTTVAGNTGYFLLTTAAASFTMTSGHGILVETPSIGAGSTITTVYGLRFNAQTGGGTNYVWHAATTTNASHLTQAGHLTIGAGVTITLGSSTTGTALSLPLSTTSISSLRIPHGAAPSAPTDGDVWTTSSGAFVRIAGATHQVAGGGATDSGTVITNITVVDGRITAITVE